MELPMMPTRFYNQTDDDMAILCNYVRADFDKCECPMKVEFIKTARKLGCEPTEVPYHAATREFISDSQLARSPAADEDVEFISSNMVCNMKNPWW